MIEKKTIDHTYSLEKGILNELSLNNDRLRLSFYQGFYKNNEIVKGSIIIQNIEETSYVYIYKEKGNTRIGKKIELATYIHENGKQAIEIIKEYYGYRKTLLIGRIKDDLYIELYIDHKQSIVFDIVEVIETVKQVNHEDPYLIKNTTKEERRAIVYQSLGMDIGCETGDFDTSMYDDYIEGIVELKDINKRYYDKR